MKLQEQLKQKREELGKAVADAKALGAKVTNAREKNEAWGELEEPFIKARDAAFALGKEVQHIESQAQLEQMETELDTPVDNPLRAEHSEHRLENPRRRQKGPQVSREAHAAGLEAYLRTHANGNPIRNAYQAMEQAGSKPEEINALLESDDSLGGFTVSEDFRAEVIRALPGFSIVRRSGARVIQTAKPGITMPTVNRAATNPKQYTSDMNQGDSNWKKEGTTTGGTAPAQQSKPTFGQERVPVHLWQPDAVELTQELLEDSDAPLEMILAELFAETRGFDEDVSFLLGDGVGKPEGITESGATAVVVGDASTYATPAAGDNGIHYNRIVNIYVSLAAQYRQNAVWMMNSDTFGLILKLSDVDTSQPLFPINQLPGTLLTRPMFFTEFLSNLDTDGNIGVIFGDPRYYVIAERRDMTISRLVERFAPNVGILPTARVGGQVVLTEAFRLGSTQA